MLERLRTILGSKAQTNRQEFVSGTIRPQDVYGYSRAPERQARAIAHLQGYVYAACMLNARSIASQPLKLYATAEKRGFKSKKTSKNTQRYLRGDTSLRPCKSVLAHTGNQGEIVEIYDHPILDLLHNVSPFIDGYQFTVLRKIMLQATGNEYLHPIIGPEGYPIELHVLPSQMVKINPVRDERIIDSYVYGNSPNEVEFAPDEVLHNKTPSPIDPLYGVGWVTAAESSAELLEHMDGYEKQLFENQARPDWGIFLKDNLNEVQWNRMLAYIDQNLRGNRNAGRPYIFEGGSDARPLQFSPRDLAFSDGELRKVESIAAVSGVPVSLLRANDPNLASAEVGFASYMRDTIHPYLISDTEFLNQTLLPLFGDLGDGLFLAYDNPVSEDIESNSRVFLSEVAQGVRTINEARSELGLEPVEDGDELRVNGVPLATLAQPAPAFGQLNIEQSSQPVASESYKSKAESVRRGQYVEWRTEKGIYIGQVESVDGEVADVRVFVRLDPDDVDGEYERSDRVVEVEVEKLTVTNKPDIVEKAVSEKVKEALRNKMEEHNEEVNNAEGKRATLRMLTAVYERGIGAYATQPGSVRPQVSSAEQWAMARVNGFLHALRTGKFKRGKFDTDLLPAKHPLSTKDDKSYHDVEEEKRMVAQDVFSTIEEAEERAAEMGGSGHHAHPGEFYGVEGEIYMPFETHEEYLKAQGDAAKKYESIDFSPPKDVQEEAALGLEWRREHNRGGTGIGVARARDLSNGVSMSPETIGRMVNFFGRHEVDKEAEGFERGEDGYPSAGRIAWALWGGDPGKRWSSSIYEKMQREDGAKVVREDGESLNDCVARGIETLTREGYKRDQAIAIAYAQCGQRSIKTCTGLESGIEQKCGEGGEDWHPTQKAARILVEEVLDFDTPPADVDVEREGEPETPATRIARNLTKVFDKQKEAVLAELNKSKKSISRAQMFALLGLVGGFEDQLADAVLDPMVLALSAGHTFAAEEGGFDLSGDTVNRLAAEYAANHAASFAKQNNAASVRELRRILSQGIEKGLSLSEIEKNIANHTVFNRSRAKIIARTETARAFTEGELQAMEQSDSVEGKKWLKAPMACPFCEDAAKKTADGPIGVRDPFYAAGVINVGGKKLTVGEIQAPPLHPNCRCGIRSVRRKIIEG